MRLAWRVFLSTSLVMLVLIGIAAWSLRAVNGFVHTNATIVERTVPALRLETSLRETLVAALPIAILAGLAGASLVAFGMARTLRRLSTAAGEIAAGTFPEPVVVRGSDEIAQLGDAFNRMARQLGELDRMKQDFFAHI